MKVSWSPSIPRELVAAAKPHIVRYLPSLPPWCERLAIELDTEAKADDETVYMSVTAQEEMRTATLNINANWLQLDDDQREDVVAHEFAHLPFMPASDICDEILSSGAAPTPLRTQWERRVEAATQDYAKVFRKAYGK